jgi:hypothetical protein
MKTLNLYALLRTAALLLASFSLHQCVVPYETARMLPKGETEIKGSFTHVRASFDGDSEKADNGVGLGIGYGVSDKVNIKFRYENLKNNGSVNFISFGPKFALKQDRIAAALPSHPEFISRRYPQKKTADCRRFGNILRISAGNTIELLRYN